VGEKLLSTPRGAATTIKKKDFPDYFEVADEKDGLFKWALNLVHLEDLLIGNCTLPVFQCSALSQCYDLL
jgi:hypothetical protein